jgi:DHA3 family macrolide efflux protein-like MFS transporter
VIKTEAVLVEKDQIVERWDSNWAAPFFTIWTGQAFSLFGSQLVQFALVWWLTKTTGSATVLATASLVGLLPQVFLGPMAGALVDRWNRRITMILADSIVAAASILLAIIFISGKEQIWQVYLILFVRAAAGGFHWPAMQASTSLMVPKEHLSRIQGFNQMLNGAMNIASAPIGALLLSLLIMPGILAIDVGTALLGIILLFFINIPQPKISASLESIDNKSSLGADLRAGLHYVWSWPGMTMILLIATVINLLLTPAFSLLPILVTKHFSQGALQLAFLESSWGIGVVIGGLVLGIWGGFHRRILTTFLGLLLAGLASIAIGLVPSSAFVLAIGAIFIAGFSNPIINGPIFAVVQAAVDPGMQGRVFTLMGSVASAMSPIGLVIAGPVADIFGVGSWFLIGGFVTIAMGVVGFFVPAILHLEDGRVQEVKVEHDLAIQGVEIPGQD